MGEASGLHGRINVGGGRVAAALQRDVSRPHCGGAEPEPPAFCGANRQ